MKSRLFLFALIIFSNTFGQEDVFQSDTLYKVCRDEPNPIIPFFSNCGYSTKNGDTIIPIGRYAGCFSDEFVNFAVVTSDTSSVPFAVNRDGEVLFSVMWLDGEVWPDELNENRIRIVEDGKIGFANQDGVIVIKPQYGCASVFENGRARVAYTCGIEKIDEEHSRNVSENWIYIDKDGIEIE